MAFPKKHGTGGYKGKKSFDAKKPWDRGGDRHRNNERPDMHRATCAQCNSSCEVPFKPNGTRPILCSNCFKRDDDRPSFNKPSFSRPPESSVDLKEQLNSLNSKLDTIIKVLHRIADEK